MYHIIVLRELSHFDKKCQYSSKNIDTFYIDAYILFKYILTFYQNIFCHLNALFANLLDKNIFEIWL